MLKTETSEYSYTMHFSKMLNLRKTHYFKFSKSQQQQELCHVGGNS